MPVELGGAPPSAWQTGFQGRCPRCGDGPLYSSFLKVADQCTVCGLDLSGEDAGDGAQPFIILLIGAVGVLVGAVVMLRFDTPVWVPIVIACPIVTGLGWWLLPRVKGLLIALQYINRAGDTGGSNFGDDR